MVKRWTVGQSHFPRWAEGPSCETEATPEPIIKMKKNNETFWNNNTHLCVNLKTQLRSDRYAKTGQSYQGVLRRDVFCEEFCYEDHFTFTETLPQPAQKRNPHVYNGQYITVTRHADGTYRPNLKPMKVDKDFSVAKYASGVANELLWALEGLVGRMNNEK